MKIRPAYEKVFGLLDFISKVAAVFGRFPIGMAGNCCYIFIIL